MILVGQYDSPFTRRVAVALHWYGLAFSRDARSIFGDAQALGQISPLTRIPALVLENGDVLIDSAAILDWLDEGASLPLLPRHGIPRREAMQLTALACGMMDKAAAVVYERHLHPPAHRNADWQTRCLGQTRAGLLECTRRLHGPYACGAEMTHADVMITCAIGYLQDRLPEALEGLAIAPLLALAAHCETLPAFVSAQVSPGETMPST